MILTKGIISRHMKQCCDLYNQDATSFEDVNYAIAISSLSRLAMDAYYRVILENEEVVGWVIATYTTTLLSGKRELAQQYYYSKFTGRKAVEAVLLVHRDLIKHAEKRGIQEVSSHSSHYDSTNVLCRILAKDGWLVQGYAAKYRTSHY